VNELLLTAIRFGFLALLWIFLAIVVSALRRDLRVSQGVAVYAKSPKVQRQRTANLRSTGLVIVDGPLAGATMTLSAGDITIGRAPDCSIVLTDDYVSSKHTRMRKVDDTWFVEDLESTNGTWVNRKRITAPMALTPGMSISVGRTNFRITS